MIKLRPHHLLCIQGFIGKGYSDEFVTNMKSVIENLNNKDTKINIEFSTDDICSHCPNMMGDNLCKSDNKVNTIDKKVIEYFKLEEKEYVYRQLIDYIKKNITSDIMDDICKYCEWYHNSPCKKNIVK